MRAITVGLCAFALSLCSFADGKADQPTGYGTAFFISPDGFALTSFHVIQGANTITLRQGSSVCTAQVVRVDRANDMALIKAKGRFSCVPLGNAATARLGDPVATIGFPNPEVQGTQPKVTKGEISSTSGAQDDPRLFQVSVPLQPGNSGGPLFNKFGEVIGVTAAQLDAIGMMLTQGSIPQNVNYAVKIAYATPLLAGSAITLAPARTSTPPVEPDFTRLAAAVCQVIVSSTSEERLPDVSDSFDQRRGAINPVGMIDVTLRNNNPYYVRNLVLRVSMASQNTSALSKPPTFIWKTSDLVAPAENYELTIFHQTYAELLKMHREDSDDSWFPFVHVVSFDKVKIE